MLAVFTSCSKDSMIDCQGQNIILLNHRITPVQLQDDQGNPLQKVNGLGRTFAVPYTVTVDGVEYSAEDCDCGCKVIHIY